MADVIEDKAHGLRQSPINIDLHHCHHDTSLHPLQFDHDPSDCVEVVNKGTTWSVRVKSDAKTKLSGPHLPGTYRLAELHAHWGEKCNDGSEHLIGQNGYAAEVHLVHYNEKYESVDTAKSHGDGLAVLGILLEESQADNPALEPLIKALEKVKYKGQTAPFPQPLDLSKLLPSNRDYCTYLGSLTTPPFTECVVWTVFAKPSTISHRQLQGFRSLCTHEHDAEKAQEIKIVNNVRAAQGLGQRQVRASFKPT